MGAVKDTPFASHAATACVAVDPSELRPEDRQRGQVDGGRSSNRRTSFGLNSVINAARRSFELRASNNKEEVSCLGHVGGSAGLRCNGDQEEAGLKC